MQSSSALRCWFGLMCVGAILMLLAEFVPDGTSESALADESGQASARPSNQSNGVQARSSVSKPAAPPSPPVEALVSRSDPLAIFEAGVPGLDAAKDVALDVLARDVITRSGYLTHTAGPGYDTPWLRDSFAWGMIPSDSYSELAPYSASELRFWLGQQRPSGQWITNPQSGYYDETAIMICASLDAYRLTGNRALLQASIAQLRKGWAWLRTNPPGVESAYLLWTPVQGPATPLKRLPVSVDWADQIGRRDYAGQLNTLWYRATQSMAQIEAVLGNASEAAHYTAFAEHIKSDFNRLLWTQGPVYARNAPAVAPFGHYRSWYPGDRDYFELDTNLQAVIYGLADSVQSQAILGFVQANEAYLLGSENGNPPPAKSVYGQYAPEDYAAIRSRIGDDKYQNAYWMPIGGLAARAFWQAGRRDMVGRVMQGLSGAFYAGRPATSAAEWYDASGQPNGSPAYEWSARSFLEALFRAYLGVDDDWSNPRAENLRVNPLFGGASGRIKHLGKIITVRTHGSGSYQTAVVDGATTVASELIPEALLHDGTNIDLYLTGQN